MLSERLYSYMGWVWPWDFQLGCSFYTWDKSKRIFIKPVRTSTTVTYNNMVFGLLLLGAFAYELFQLIRSYLAVKYADSIFVLGVIFCALLVFGVLFLTTLWAEQWFLMLNCHFVFFATLQSECVSNKLCKLWFWITTNDLLYTFQKLSFRPTIRKGIGMSSLLS